MEIESPHSKNKIDEKDVDIWRKIQKSFSGDCILQMTSSLIISRCCQDENSKEMYQKY